MKTYFLQQDKDGRKLIDDFMHDHCKKLASVQAESWKEAKEALLM